jgi:hypothetical protein
MARRTAQQRLKDTVLSQGVLGLEVFGEEVTVEPWMVAQLRAAEASIRRMRRQMEERLAGVGGRVCAACGRPFAAARTDARYCSGRCRQATLRSRRGDG